MTFTEMVTRLERLEAENDCLKAELKKASINIDKLRAERELHTTKDRQLIPRINTKTYEKMFKICANSKGEIVKGTNEDGSKIFTRFWRGVAMIFKPTIGTSTGSTADYKLEPFALQSLSDGEFEIFAELISDIVDMIEIAQTNMKK